MNKSMLAVLVSVFACGGVVSSAFADSTSVNGGQVEFVGQVVDAACSVTADTADQVVQMDQVRTVKLATPGQVAGQQTPFNIQLEDCDASISTNAGVTFLGQADPTTGTALANQAGAGGATNVALQLYGPDGNIMALGNASSTVPITGDATNPGSVTIPLSVDYIATAAAATAGSVDATATFSINYS